MSAPASFPPSPSPMPADTSDTESICVVPDISPSMAMPASAATSTMTASQKRSRFYNEMVVFQVEDTLFRESKRYFAANSAFFRDLFSQGSQAGEANAMAGQTDENPLILENVSVEDFECLLSIISPITPHEQVDMSTNEWKGVLKLSTKWGMTSLCKHCINHLSPLPSDMPITSKILFARECMVIDWLVDAYNELAQRKESLSQTEVTEIGVHDAIRLLRVREKWILDKEASGADHIGYCVFDRTNYNYRDSIRMIFCDEIDHLQREAPELGVKYDGSISADSISITNGKPKKKAGYKKK